jgi:small-conductance mechanosensitive channel
MIRSIVKTPPFKNADVLREWRRRIIEEFDRNGIQLAQKPDGNVGRPS